MYKEYTMDQLSLPMDLQEDNPKNHLVRVINDAVNHLDMNLFTKAYPGGGRDRLPPQNAYEGHHLCLHAVHLLFSSNRESGT